MEVAGSFNNVCGWGGDLGNLTNRDWALVGSVSCSSQSCYMLPFIPAPALLLP